MTVKGSLVISKYVIIEYTEDKRLLNQVTNSPDDLCDKCDLRSTGGCLGCPEQRAYDTY